MKSLLFSFVVSVCLLAGNRATAQNSNSPFKNGDWFECEMEFENGLPVFRNHYFNRDTLHKENQLLSLRFTYGGKTADGADKWNYKVLRFKTMVMNISEPKEKPNLLCYDTWYPDFFDKSAHAIRDSLTGYLYLSNSAITKHEFNYQKHNNPMLPSFLNFQSGNVKYEEIYSMSASSPERISDLTERVADFIFRTSAFKEKKTQTLSIYEVSEVKTNSRSERRFTLGHKKNNATTNKTYTAFLLTNGLPYAFTDSNAHKVLTITNASFAIPNNAVVTITDNRLNKQNDSKYFTNLLGIEAENPAHIIRESGTPSFVHLRSQNEVKRYSLKCGALFTVFFSGKLTKLYIEPGDSLAVTITDDVMEPISIQGNVNNNWLVGNKNSLTESEITNAPISPELKSYLKLNNEIEKRLKSNSQETDMEVYTKSILDFFVLKSYHYTHFFGKWLPICFVQVYNSRKEDALRINDSTHGMDVRYNTTNHLCSIKTLPCTTSFTICSHRG